MRVVQQTWRYVIPEKPGPPLTIMIICAAAGLGTAGVLGSTSASAVPSEKNSTIQAATPYCYTIYILGKGYQHCSYI